MACQRRGAEASHYNTCTMHGYQYTDSTKEHKENHALIVQTWVADAVAMHVAKLNSTKLVYKVNCETFSRQ